MAIPHEHLTPSELLYLAEQTPTIILPRTRLPPLPLLSGFLPALTPPHRATVPLWLALLLKAQRKAHIIPPDWLNADYLDALVRWEHEHTDRFAEVPWRWVEIGELLLGAMAEEMADGEEVRVKLRELREVRWGKAREGLKGLESTYLQMNGLGHLEISELRPYAKSVMDNLRRITASREEARARKEEEDQMKEEEEDDDDDGL